MQQRIIPTYYPIGTALIGNTLGALYGWYKTHRETKNTDDYFNGIVFRKNLYDYAWIGLNVGFFLPIAVPYFTYQYFKKPNKNR